MENCIVLYVARNNVTRALEVKFKECKEPSVARGKLSEHMGCGEIFTVNDGYVLGKPKNFKKNHEDDILKAYREKFLEKERLAKAKVTAVRTDNSDLQDEMKSEAQEISQCASANVSTAATNEVEIATEVTSESPAIGEDSASISFASASERNATEDAMLDRSVVIAKEASTDIAGPKGSDGFDMITIFTKTKKDGTYQRQAPRTNAEKLIEDGRILAKNKNETDADWENRTRHFEPRNPFKTDEDVKKALFPEKAPASVAEKSVPRKPSFSPPNTVESGTFSSQDRGDLRETRKATESVSNCVKSVWSDVSLLIKRFNDLSSSQSQANRVIREIRDGAVRRSNESAKQYETLLKTTRALEDQIDERIQSVSDGLEKTVSASEVQTGTLKRVEGKLADIETKLSSKGLRITETASPLNAEDQLITDAGNLAVRLVEELCAAARLYALNRDQIEDAAALEEKRRKEESARLIDAEKRGQLKVLQEILDSSDIDELWEEKGSILLGVLKNHGLEEDSRLAKGATVELSEEDLPYVIGLESTGEYTVEKSRFLLGGKEIQKAKVLRVLK